ncbi:MFS transporter [Amycolatopsis keratiniphila]|uniref:MFS transporter n=1 Tax=Amycolatopsis keratiniphila TaxID=129921 RepID=UPI0033CA21AB
MIEASARVVPSEAARCRTEHLCKLTYGQSHSEPTLSSPEDSLTANRPHPRRSGSSTTAEALVSDPRQRRSILVAMCAALLAVVASVTGLNVAQPDLASAFDASQGTVIWIMNGYVLTLAALLLPLGAVGDRQGRKPVLLVGLAVFAVASAGAALAPSAGLMLAARLLGGVGAAMIMPVTLAVITSTFPAQERVRAIGVWTGVAGVGAVLGMLLSGVLVDAASWRFLFVLPVVLVLFAFAMAQHSVPSSRARSKRPFDLIGSLTSVLGVVGIVLFLHEGPERGWWAVGTTISLACGILGTAGFVVWDLRHPAPLLDMRLFRNGRLASGSVALAAVFAVHAGSAVLLFPFFQNVLGWSGVLSAVALLPMAGLMAIASGLSTRLAERIGSRATMTTGLIVTGTGLVLLATSVSADSGYLAVLPGMIAAGSGMGVSMPLATESITGALPQDHQGVASALNDIAREIGAAVGIALLGALLSAGYRSNIDSRLDGLPTATAEAARKGIAQAIASAGEREQAVARAARESFVAGWQSAMWAGASLVAVLTAFVFMRGTKNLETHTGYGERVA